MKKNAPILTCEACGGTLNYSTDGLKAACPYCGSVYTFKDEKAESLALALNRANALRNSGDFDGAITEYKAVIADFPHDAEANWGLALSIYGIEYVNDARTRRLVPTCRRTVKQSILQNEYYLAALKYADGAQADTYRTKAAVIDRLQRDIKRRMDEEEDFDVFLCFRSANADGSPTYERTIARRIYDELTRRGIKTFFSEVTLKDRIGDDYEPVIYKALYSCRFFILIAASEENFNSPWVKNEWTRFRDRAVEEGLSGACCAVYENIPFSALPPFVRGVQGVDLAKYPAGGYEIELADNLQAKLGAGGKKQKPLSRRKMSEELRDFLEQGEDELACGNFVGAAAYFSQAIQADPRCGDAWLGAFLADMEVRSFSGSKKFAQEITGRLFSTGDSVEECERGQAYNGRIIYMLNSANFKNAVKYSKNSVAVALEDGKTIITEAVKRCNGELNYYINSYKNVQEQQPQGNVQAQSGDGGVSAGAAIGAAAGAALGLLGLSRIGRRPPRGGPHGPHGPRGRR